MLFTQTNVFGSTTTTNQNTEFDNSKEMDFNIAKLNTKLQVKPWKILKDLKGMQFVYCLAKCIEYSPLCNGINFFRSWIESVVVCELLEDHYDDYDTRRKLVCDSGWVYYGLSQMSVCNIICLILIPSNCAAFIRFVFIFKLILSESIY